MIHYHGCPLGSHGDQAPRFYMGRHAMVSFAHPAELNVIAECCQSFALDNGAFSAWRGGATLDIEGFAEWVDTWKRHPGFDWHLIPDVIDGDEKANDEMIEKWLVRAEVQEASPVPVWHLHESLDRLRYLAGAFARVALGSSGIWANPGTDSWWDRMAEAMEICCDAEGRPQCKLHGLRMLAPHIFGHLPLASADSTNAAINSRHSSRTRFGIYPPLDTWRRANVIADRVEKCNSAAAWIADAWKMEDLFANLENA